MSSPSSGVRKVTFDSAEVVEAGRMVCKGMELLCNTTRHGRITLDVADGVVLWCETTMRERGTRRSGAGDPQAREPA